MKHRKSRNKLEKTASHRASLLSNMSNSILRHSRIITTLPKAKEFRKVIERLVTKAKQDTIHARRHVMRVLRHPQMMDKLFKTIAPAFKDRAGGYTRIIKLGRRMNDGAEMAIIEFVQNFVEKKAAPTETVKAAVSDDKTKTTVPVEKAKKPVKPAKKSSK